MANKLSPYKKLISNSIVLSIGNFGSKILTFVMVPLYTFKLTTNQYGTVDLIQTLSNLLLPVIFASIFDAVLRFGMEKNEEQRTLTNAVAFVVPVSAIAIVISFILQIYAYQYAFVTGMLIILQAYQSVLSQFTKAIEKVKLYSLNGILLTLVTVICNLFFLVKVNLRTEGYLLSIIIANACSILFLSIAVKVWRYISFRDLSRSHLKQMLRFSLPLVPNSVAWWMSSTVNRFFILGILGTGANGLFAVANKIPSVISMMTTIFDQAWQLSAIEEYGKAGRTKFFSNTFKAYAGFLFVCSSGVFLIIKPLFYYVFSRNYYDGWQVTPFLILTVVYSSFSGFVGANYTASKKTAVVFTSTIYGMIINLALGFGMIKVIGLLGSGMSSAIAFLTVWLLRMRRLTTDVEIHVSLIQMFGSHAGLFIQIAGMFFFRGVLEYILLVIGFSIVVIVNLTEIYRSKRHA